MRFRACFFEILQKTFSSEQFAFWGFNTNGKMNRGNRVVQSFCFYRPRMFAVKAGRKELSRLAGETSPERGRRGPHTHVAIMPFCFPCGVVTTLLFLLQRP